MPLLTRISAARVSATRCCRLCSCTDAWRCRILYTGCFGGRRLTASSCHQHNYCLMEYRDGLMLSPYQHHHHC